MLSVSLPTLEGVLKDWVTDTNDTSCASNSSTGRAEVGFKKIGRTDRAQMTPRSDALSSKCSEKRSAIHDSI
jgi:hypothetical protein